MMSLNAPVTLLARPSLFTHLPRLLASFSFVAQRSFSCSLCLTGACLTTCGDNSGCTPATSSAHHTDALVWHVLWWTVYRGGPSRDANAPWCTKPHYCTMHVLLSPPLNLPPPYWHGARRLAAAAPAVFHDIQRLRCWHATVKVRRHDLTAPHRLLDARGCDASALTVRLSKRKTHQFYGGSDITGRACPRSAIGFTGCV